MTSQYKYGNNPERQKNWEWLIGGNEKITEELKRNSPGGAHVEPHRADYVRIATEILLENTREQIANDLGDKKMMKLTPEKFYEEIDSSSIVPFTRFALPMIRRVTPRLYARSLVGFQPMTMPDGKIFYLNMKYGTAKYPTLLGDRVDLPSKMNKAYGGAKSYDTFTATSAQTVFTLTNYGAKNVKVYDNGVLYSAGSVTVTAGGGGGTSATPDTVTLGVGITLNHTVLITYDNVAEGDTARDIDMGMESSSITAEAIKLRSAMTVETIQDFSAYHGISSEAELTAAMAAEVDREIDLNILSRLFYNAAAGNVNWDSAGYLAGDDNTLFQKEYRRTLYEALVATNNLIYKKRFVNATWIVCGVGFSERLEKLENFVLNTTPDAADSGQVARRYMGVLAGKFQVYKDPRLSDSVALMGFNGDSPFQTGAVFAPYIPAYMTDLLPDPNINFKVRKGIMSRFGFAVPIPDVYATCTIL